MKFRFVKLLWLIVVAFAQLAVPGTFAIIQRPFSVDQPYARPNDYCYYQAMAIRLNTEEGGRWITGIPALRRVLRIEKERGTRDSTYAERFVHLSKKNELLKAIIYRALGGKLEQESSPEFWDDFAAAGRECLAAEPTLGSQIREFMGAVCSVWASYRVSSDGGQKAPSELFELVQSSITTTERIARIVSAIEGPAGNCSRADSLINGLTYVLCPDSAPLFDELYDLTGKLRRHEATYVDRLCAMERLVQRLSMSDVTHLLPGKLVKRLTTAATTRADTLRQAAQTAQDQSTQCIQMQQELKALRECLLQAQQELKRSRGEQRKLKDQVMLCEQALQKSRNGSLLVRMQAGLRMRQLLQGQQENLRCRAEVAEQLLCQVTETLDQALQDGQQQVGCLAACDSSAVAVPEQEDADSLSVVIHNVA